VPLTVDIIGRGLGDEQAQRRVARNQPRLRKLNDALRGAASDRIAFRCECGQLGCNRLIQLTPAEFAAVRAHPRRFAIAPGHEIVEIEAPVEHHDRYVVVEAYAPEAQLG